METISLPELKKLIDSKSKLCLLIDVRTPEEVLHGMIPTAHHLPIDELEDALSMNAGSFEKQYHFPFPRKEQLLIFYCHSGTRSAFAVSLAAQKGYHAKNLQGNVEEWNEFTA